MPVEIIDKTTPALSIKMNQITNTTNTSALVEEFSYFITVDSTAGISVGSYIILFSDLTGRYYKGKVIAIVGSVLEMDTQVDSEFPSGSFVDVAITNMAVNGSVTPQIFGVRGLATPENTGLTFDITRIIITCLTTTAVDLSKFGDLSALTRGLVLRKRDGTTFNVFNVKSNEELEGVTLDWKAFAATNPSQGQDGFSCRLTFSGQDKLGVVERLRPGEDLEIVVQDDLTGIELLEVTAQGHEIVV